MLSRQAIPIAAIVLALFAAPVIGQELEGEWVSWFADPAAADPWEPLEAYPVEAGEAFALDIYGLIPEPPFMVFGYSLDFTWTDPAIGFDGYADARGWPAAPASAYPLLEYRTDGLPLLPPADAPFALGTISLTAPSAAGGYMLGMAPETSVLYLSPFPSEPGIPCVLPIPVTVLVPPPGPAPVPALYHMGTVVNGDFETGGGSLDGWTTSAYGNNTVTVETLENGHTDHAAKLHSEGDWWWDPWMPGSEWHYDSGSASISQTVYVPLDATELSFLYCTRSGGELAGDPDGYVRLGDGSAWFVECVDWTTFVLPVDEADKGRRVQLRLTAYDGGYGWVEGWEAEPETTAWLDLYLDYIGINGTAATIQTTTWAAGAGGGPWGLAGNWNPGDVPHNTLGKIHDVVIPESASGDGTITVSAPRTIQTLNDNRTQGTLEVESGGSLNVFEDVNIAGATVRILPGGQVSALSNLTVTDGALMIHPDGSAAGGEALTVEKTLKLGTYSWEGGTSADLSVCDATVIANILDLRSQSTATLTKSPAFEGPTSLVVNHDINVQDSSTLTIGSGTEVVTPDLYVSSSAVVNVEDGGTIRDLSPGYTNNYGTINMVGAVLFDQDNFNNRGALNVSGGTSHFTGHLRDYSGGELTVSGATLRIDGSLYLYDGCTVTADDQSTIALGADLVNWMEDGSAFHLDAARMLFDTGGASAMNVAGMNRGPFTTGLIDNFALGALEVGGPTNLQLNQTGAGGALYVHDLVLGSGSTLNLGGVPLYYANQFINNGGSYSGGEPQRLYARPPGLPPVAPVDYTASVEALWNSTTVTNGPAELHDEQWGAGWEGWPATADAFADLTQIGDTAVLKITISGESGVDRWEDPWDPGMPWEEPIPTNASGELTGTVRVGESGDYPAGTALELLILVNQRSTWTGDDFQWSCQVEHGDDVVLFDAANTDPVTWMVLAGDELAVLASMSDNSWSGGFDHTLEVSFTTTPEPATLALLVLGGACLLLRRKRR